MRRKLVKQGVNALTITLPHKWVKEQSLKVGDEVDVCNLEQDLLISSSLGLERNQKHKELTIRNFSRNQLRSVIASLYKAGYDQMTFHFDKIPSYKVISSIVAEFTGLEIVSLTPKEVAIKSFVKFQKEEVEKLIIRLLQTTIYLSKELDLQWTNTNEEEFTVLTKQTSIKMRDHCLRFIHQGKYMQDKAHDYYDFVTIVEKTTTEIFYLSNAVRGSNCQKPKLVTEITKLIEKMYLLYLKKNFTISTKYWTEIRNYSKKRFELSNQTKKYSAKELQVILHSYHLVKLLRHLSSRLVNISN
jgi:hypothetical protein